MTLGDSILLLAVPVMLFGFSVTLIMHAWVWRLIKRCSLHPRWGGDYAVLNPNGLVIWFDFRLVFVVMSESRSILSVAEVRWLLFYAFIRILSVLASIAIGIVKILGA